MFFLLYASATCVLGHVHVGDKGRDDALVVPGVRVLQPAARLATVLGVHGLELVKTGLGRTRPVKLSRFRRPAAGPQMMAAADEEIDAADVSGFYESLQKRRSQLSSRTDAVLRERELVAKLADVWPNNEHAQDELWEHWYGEEGEAASEALVAAEGNATALTELINDYPDWVEPTNRLATLRYNEGDFKDSVTLCLRILRNKPWHFGASSGIVMCYVRLAERANVLRQGALVDKANKWAQEAMPRAGPQREEWVSRMLTKIDRKLEALSDL